MKLLFVQYPKCGTCKKAANWLNINGIDVDIKHIVEDAPTFEELKAWYEHSGLPIKKFFNTSGRLYREMGLKERIKDSTDDELLELLASDGMLVKRPILVSDDFVLVGFKESEWHDTLNGSD